MEVLAPAGLVFTIHLCGMNHLPISRPTRSKTALMAASCALCLICGPAAKSQNSSATPQAANPGTKTKTAASSHRKTSSSNAKKPAASGTTKSSSRSASHSTSAKHRRTSHSAAGKVKKTRGQRQMDSERVQAIQEALIREHYLSGEASGTWNQTSEDAMRRYQADHGWQSKTVPDSRALIKLGLGPSHDHLLNPESAMTTQPDMPRATPLDTSSHSADPGVPGASPAVADPAPASNGSSGPSSPQ